MRVHVHVRVHAHDVGACVSAIGRAFVHVYVCMFLCVHACADTRVPAHVRAGGSLQGATSVCCHSTLILSWLEQTQSL